ncbi:hypothetical protein GCM10017557_69930 [Streptomyces aurantiacus]|uniref:Uncharacterized protein n=1 Tax=Streptomyces aurantiacus TaxID=47760 RepID=A0A7G1PDH7_9ACTN|nr:hypothetical protein GCM10017557_69930 [Streptomyces aurantiacus]
MLRNNSQEPSQDAAGSRVLGALVVPTTIGPSPSEESEENTPHPVIRDMDAIADKCRRDRFRLNTRTLLDLPCHEVGRTISQRPARRTALTAGHLTCTNIICAGVWDVCGIFIGSAALV